MKIIIYRIFISYFILLSLFVNVYAYNDWDWMSSLSDDLTINQINIPGTHDSGTYDIGMLGGTASLRYGYSAANFILQTIKLIESSVRQIAGQTQDLSIKEQLESGIRYFDVRLDINNDNNYLKLVHGPLSCMNGETNTYLYLIDIINSCTAFLRDHNKETIIIHLKNENNVEDKKIAELFTKTFINSRNIDYFYVPYNIDDEYTNKHLPTLGMVRGKIVFFLRSKFYYNDKNIQPTEIDVNEPPMEYSTMYLTKLYS